MPTIRQFSCNGSSYSGGDGVVITATKNGKPYYSIIPTSGHIIKMGYCCEAKGCGHAPNNIHADYPIFITQMVLEGTSSKKITSEIEIGKSCIYETAVDEEALSSKTNYITQIDVPQNLKYTLDYILS